MARKGSAYIISAAAFLMAMLLWGSSFVAMKYAVGALDPMTVVFWRMLVGTLCFLPFLRSFSRLKITRSHILLLVGMGLCEPCLYFLFESTALRLTTASQASLITTMLPPMVAVAAAVFLREKIPPRVLVGLGLAVSGAVWLSLSGKVSDYAPSPLLGNFLEFMAMVSATGYIILLKKLSGSLPALFLTAMQSLIGTIFFLPLMLVFGQPVGDPLPTAAIWSVLYLGVVVSAGAYGLYNFGVSRVPANQAAMYINLIPVFALLLGALLLDERLTDRQYLAGALVFAGVFYGRGRYNG